MFVSGELIQLRPVDNQTVTNMYTTEKYSNSTSAYSNHTSGPTKLTPIKYYIDVGEGIHKYWLAFIVPVGFVGNILSFLVMTQPHNRGVSCSLYMAALAVSDTGVLIDLAAYWYIYVAEVTSFLFVLIDLFHLK